MKGRDPRLLGPQDLIRLYDRARRRVVGGGPPLQLFRVDPGPFRPPDALFPAIVRVFERAIVRARFPPGAVTPAIAVRLDVETTTDPAATSTVVVRVYDTGPVSDPREAAPLPALAGVEVRREPPAGPWSGIVALRFAAAGAGAATIGPDGDARRWSGEEP